MTITVTAKGRTFNFPDGTSQEQIGEAVDGFFAAQPETPGLGEQFLSSLVSQAEQVAGIPEAGAAIASAIPAEVGAGLAGIGALTPGGRTPTEAIEQTREALTLEPRTASGQAIVGAAGEALAPVGEAFQAAEQGLGDAAFEATGSPLLASIATSIPTAIGEFVGIGGASKASKAVKVRSALQQQLARDIKQFRTDKRFVSRMVNGSGRVVKDRVAMETIRQGFDDGVIAAVKGGSALDRAQMRKMVDVLERGKGNALFAARNRPADVAGTSLLKRVDHVRKVNRDAGKRLDSVAKSLKGQPVDLTAEARSFFDDLNEMGVRFDPNLKPDFTGSDIETIAPAKRLVKDLSLKIRQNPQADAFDAHKFKRFIDENVTFGKAAKGLGGKTERIAKSFRRAIDTRLDETFPEYNLVNTQFSDTVQAIDALQDAAGKKVNLFGENAAKATGTVLRRLMSNTQSRVRLMDAISQIEEVGRKHGGNFTDDILTQMLFADELDAMFGAPARTSLQGEVAKAVTDSARRTMTDRAVDFAGEALEKARGINEANAIKSIRELLQEPQS